MTGQLIQPRDKVIEYIQAILVSGYTKKDAYSQFIDSKVKNPHQAIAKMEKKKEYQEIYQVITSDENYKFMLKAQKVRGKYLNVVERNIDTLDSLFDDVKKSGDLKNKGAVVRLANETIQALAVVSGQSPEAPPGAPRLDKASVVS